MLIKRREVSLVGISNFSFKVTVGISDISFFERQRIKRGTKLFLVRKEHKDIETPPYSLKNREENHFSSVFRRLFSRLGKVFLRMKELLYETIKAVIILFLNICLNLKQKS